jgi:hypothetical protein
MPLVKISWGIFYKGLFSTMINAFEYVHATALARRTFQDKELVFLEGDHKTCVYKRRKLHKDLANSNQFIML